MQPQLAETKKGKQEKRARLELRIWRITSNGMLEPNFTGYFVEFTQVFFPRSPLSWKRGKNCVISLSLTK